MSVSEKIKTIDNNIEQDKAQYNSDRQTAKISALSSGNVSKYEFLTCKDVLPEKDLLEEAATMKRFEYSPLGKELKAQTDIAKKQYSPLGKELKAQTDIAKKQYQKLDDTFGLDKIIKKEKPTLENYSKSNLLYDANHSFYRYYRDKKNLITFLSNQCILF